ncbi:MAG: cobalamin biosynthesis protein CobD [Treponema sp.]|nr:cobalamin biosynthesis protein CobD [Treponema sp.]
MNLYLLFQFFKLPAAFLLDALLGDPRCFPHPVVLLGKLIAHLESLFRAVFPSTKWGERIAGGLLALVVCMYAFTVPFLLIYGLMYCGLRFEIRALVYASCALDVFWGYQCLAARNLRDEADNVYMSLSNSLKEGRAAVGRIVGRDTDMLDKPGVIKACVETVAESTTDGVVAPMIAYAVGGAPLAFLYKAINTMDSMIGYKNTRYRYFGTVAARFDDVANGIASRIAALSMIIGALVLYLCSVFSRYAFPYNPIRAARTFLRDRYKHESPNAGQTESACAGALRLQLGGDAYYGGILERRPYLGRRWREPEIEDIHRSVKLMYAASVIAMFVCTLAKLFAIIHMFNPAWF